MKLVGAIRKHLSIPGESINQTAAEIKRLTDADKADLRAWFAAEGIEVEPDSDEKKEG